MKLRSMVALVAALCMGGALAQDTGSDRGKLSYAIGYEIGKDFTERKMEVDLNTVIRGIQDGYAKKNPTVPEEEMRAALEAMQQRMVEQARTEFEKLSAENKTKSSQFLAQNRTKSGVVVLPSGIQYRVIEDGTGARPTANSQVKIHFRGSLSTGLEFASTYQGNQPLTLQVSQAPLPGLKEILPLMKQGARWEVFLPPEHGYGDGPRSPVGPNQAVVFDVRLVEIL